MNALEVGHRLARRHGRPVVPLIDQPPQAVVYVLEIAVLRRPDELVIGRGVAGRVDRWRRDRVISRWRSRGKVNVDAVDSRK